MIGEQAKEFKKLLAKQRLILSKKLINDVVGVPFTDDEREFLVESLDRLEAVIEGWKTEYT